MVQQQRRSWLVLLLVLSLLLTACHCQEDGDYGGADEAAPVIPDPVPQPPPPPPKVVTPPKEQGPVPAEPPKPLVPAPGLSPPPPPAAAQPTTTTTTPQPAGSAAAGPGPRPPVTPTPTPPGAVPGSAGPQPTAPVVTPPPGAAAAGAAGATPPGVPPTATATPPGAPATTPIPGAAVAVPPTAPTPTGGAAVAPGGVPGLSPGVPVPGGGAGGAAGGVGVVGVPGAVGGAGGAGGGVVAPAADGQQPQGVPVLGDPAAAAAAPGVNASSGNSSAADNSTAIKGLAPTDQSEKLVSALLGALGATSSTPSAERPNPIDAFEQDPDDSSSSSSAKRRKKTRQRTRKTRKSARARSSSSSGTAGINFQDIQSSSSYKEGMLTTADGQTYCVADRDMFAEQASAGNQQQLGGGGTKGFSFAAAVRVFDPACDDDAINKSKYCSGESRDGRGDGGGDIGGGGGSVLVQPAAGNNSSSSIKISSSKSSSSRDLMQATQPISITVPTVQEPTNPSPSPSPAPVVNASALACTQAFTKMGSAPRSVAVVLIKWSRNYYRSREECCREQGNPYMTNGCDCQWNGYTWDNLPPPSAYSRMFTDECDGKPSINRAFYDLSGGLITFHGKTRVPSPASLATDADTGTPAAPETPPSLVDATSNSNPAAPPPSPISPAQAPINSLAGYITDKSYIDPDGVDVYGWAVLDSMRSTESGECKDWCGDAIAQLGLNASDYNHVMCMALYSNSKTICSACDATKTACAGTCPADSTVTMAQGCGCASCSFAWGQQASCSKAVGPGARTGLSVPVATYDEVEPPLLPVLPPRALLKMDRGNKLYMSHELGHNLGLNHAGALRCATSGNVITRNPAGCSPDTYGDATTFMGGGSDLQLPNVYKYKLRWLPKGTIKEHQVGTEQRYTLRASTSRRPSWQDSSTIRWFDPMTDVLAVRVPLTRPTPEAAALGGYICPCGECGPSVCDTNEQCKAASLASGMGSCCMAAQCADQSLSYLYLELHQPYRNDNNPSYKGIAIRVTGELASCTSTRAVATHLDADGKAKFLLDVPDPTGAVLGSRFDDPYRGVSVILEEWTRSQAVVRVIA